MAEQLSQALILARIDDTVGAAPQDPWSLGRSLVTAVADILRDAHITVQLDDLIAAAKSAYDRQVAPLDIPWVPNLIEPMVDQLIWQSIESMIRALHSRLGQ